MRTNSLLLTALLLSLSAAFVPGAVRGEDQAKPQGVLWVIPHTHWEGAVFKTREEYLDIGLPHILKAMRLLRDAAELQVRAGPGRLRPAVSGAISRGGRRIPQVCRRGTAPTRAGGWMSCPT